MWDEDEYCWVVICKNKLFHRKENRFYGHKIPLARTDAFSSPPALKGFFTATCDDCHKEYVYGITDVMRHELELPASFQPHPLFYES